VRRVVVAALAAVIVMAAVAGVAVWLSVRDRAPRRPEISAYSHGHLTRVGPYRYCNVLNLNDCQQPQTQGELPVNARDAVQLSVPTAIGRAPWRLLRVYEDPRNTSAEVFRPNTRLAVTIPTVDPQRGRLTGVVVQLLTLVLDQSGQIIDVPHAEWSVRTVWS
jgi:hypothetical protein